MCMKQKINRESEKLFPGVMTTVRNLPLGAISNSDGFFPCCGKPTNFFAASRFFDGFSLGETWGGVENPVENVDNRTRFPRGAAVILGNYVYQNLPLVVARKECRTVTSP